MKLKEIGEFGLIDRFAPRFLENLSERTVGIGDDCAVIKLDSRESQLVTTDLLIEDTHFLRDKISPQDLGYKSLAVNLSDIAAMGGTPTSAFLSIGIPPEIEIEWLDSFFSGLHQLAQQSNTQLLGGDTTKSQKHLIINIVVLGKMKTEQIKYRSDAKPADDIFLTGPIGDSGAGLKLLLGDIKPDKTGQFLIDQHNRPKPHLEEGQWLANQESVNAMIDVSDGIDSDLQRIMQKSTYGIGINIESLPLSDQMKMTCKQHGWNEYEIAVTGGEDYCLLCTIDHSKSRRIAQEFEAKFGRELYNIGQVTNKSGELKYYYNQKPVQFKEHGYDHFK